MNAVLVISHGSRLSKTKEEVSALAGKLKERFPKAMVDYAFLELEKPSIPEGIERCIKNGATTILVLLNFLNSGKHVDEDIPALVREAQEKYPQINFRLSSPIGQHEGLIELFADTIKSSINHV